MPDITKSDATRPLPVLKARVGIQTPSSGGYLELTGASLVDHQSGSRSITQTPTFRGPSVSVGAKTVEAVTFNLANVQFDLPVMEELEKADRDRSIVQVRMDIYSKVLQPEPSGANPTIGITATVDAQKAKGGVVTFGAAADGIDYRGMVVADQILVGDVIDYTAARTAAAGNQLADAMAYIVNRIEVDPDDGSYGTVYATGSALARRDIAADVAAAKATIRAAGLRVAFSGEVEQLGSISGDAAGSPAIASGVMFRPQSAYLAKQTLLAAEDESGW